MRATRACTSGRVARLPHHRPHRRRPGARASRPSTRRSSRCRRPASCPRRRRSRARRTPRRLPGRAPRPRRGAATRRGSSPTPTAPGKYLQVSVQGARAWLSPGPARAPRQLTPVDFDPFAEPRRPSACPSPTSSAEVWSAAQMGPSASLLFNQCFTVALRGALSIGRAREAPSQPTRRAPRSAARPLRPPYGSGPDDRGRPPAVPALKDLSGLDRGGEGRASRGRSSVREGEDALRPGERPPLPRASSCARAPTSTGSCSPRTTSSATAGPAAVLLRDLGALYSAERNGAARRAPAAASYRDYVRQMAVAGGGGEAARGRGLLGRPLRGRRPGRRASPRPASAHGHVATAEARRPPPSARSSRAS